MRARSIPLVRLKYDIGGLIRIDILLLWIRNWRYSSAQSTKGMSNNRGSLKSRLLTITATHVKRILALIAVAIMSQAVAVFAGEPVGYGTQVRYSLSESKLTPFAYEKF
jgi:hypothetical protein